MLSFYNSRTARHEPFLHDLSTPLHVYTCGPTVYDEVHLGNLRTFVWSDFIISVLHALGYTTRHIMNITDIDDKIIKRLPEQTKDALLAYTTLYTNRFLEALHKLGVRNYGPHNIHRITDYVENIKQSIRTICEKGCGYVTRDGSVYFDTGAWVGTNPFASIVANKCDSESTRTIIRAEDVKLSRDFVLWKAKPEEGIHWNLEGVEGALAGRMGWHIECSAVAHSVLGKVHLKIGGSDLKHIHHAAEIYQSETICNEELYGDSWIHLGFLNFVGEKMSKSIGNVIRLQEVEERGINLFLLRMYLLSKSYRGDADFTYVDIEEGSYLRKNFINFHLLYNKLQYGFYRATTVTTKEIPTVFSTILEKLCVDFDTAGAFEALFQFVNQVYKMPLTPSIAKAFLEEIKQIDSVFHLLDPQLTHIDAATICVLKDREELRARKDFAAADVIRMEVQKQYFFEDDKTGFSLVPRMFVSTPSGGAGATV